MKIFPLRLFDSLQSRVFSLLLVGIVIAATVTLFLGERNRLQWLDHLRAHVAADRIAQMALLLTTENETNKAEIRHAAIVLGMVVTPLTAIPADANIHPVLGDALAQRLPHWQIIGANYDTSCGWFNSLHFDDCIHVQLSTPQHKFYEIRAFNQLRPMALHRIGHLFISIALFVLGIAVLAAIATRWLTRPLRELANAANELGHNIQRTPLPESGPEEVRSSHIAFNTMQAQIQRQMRDQMTMLAAITHDLQTPITRLRLRMELLDDSDSKSALINDLGNIQSLLQQGLLLARTMGEMGEKTTLDINALLGSIVDDYRESTAAVSYQAGRPVHVLGNASALHRCLQNLLDNALRYGVSADVTLTQQNHYVSIAIKDQGPGIPEADLDRVMQPFTRLESSRSRETGGTGLGLAIAQRIAEQHQGSLQLANAAEGGLIATLRLPRTEL